ncbi:hypothetical protein BuS5_03694 [Desulfosarcina sp. BuS5]|nr:hypothetical protein BuS5_03694 [Desulfosarcina sp. BuS5]
MPAPVFPEGEAGENPGAESSPTMLMFVGEELNLLSIASRREESAFKAPAIARVITGAEIRERGITTLAQALEYTPGFYMAQKEWGCQPYLRGLPDSILFLYDTVPMGMEISKTVHPLEHELSLSAIKRVEIIRGPGSVLWGPDAFAGIVNLVPLTGRDFTGMESGLIYNTPHDQKGFYVNLGYDQGLWDVFLSVSGRRGREGNNERYNITRFWDNGIIPADPENRFKSKGLNSSRLFEMAGNFSFGDFARLSGRVSDFKRPAVFKKPDSDIKWRENRGCPQHFVKLELKQSLNRLSALRFTGYLRNAEIENSIIDYSVTQKERAFYSEILYDRSFFSRRGLFTGGVSYRERNIRDALVWESYMPDFLGPENKFFLPLALEKNYDSRLKSIFGQSSFKIGDLDLMLGARLDIHDKYPDRTSYNAAVTWAFHRDSMFKLIYGTAYRTPFARQLTNNSEFGSELDLEKIRNIDLQLAWKPSNRAGVTLSCFISRIEDHVKEDCYAGLSLPNSQKISGLEIEGNIKPLPTVEISANASFIHAGGKDETYYYNDYIIINHDNTITRHYTDIKYPFDKGPGTFFNISGIWKPVESVIFSTRIGYFSSRRMIQPRTNKISTIHGSTIVDAGVTFKNFILNDLDLVVSCRNLFDRDYKTPGTYGSINGAPFETEFILRKRW